MTPDPPPSTGGSTARDAAEEQRVWSPPGPVWAWAGGGFVAAALLRWAATRCYWGSEEEDYGNLGLIVGTLQSGFRYVETEHMPLFTALAAAGMAITGGAESGGELVAVLLGSLAVGATIAMGWRWLHPTVGVLAGLALLLQPDAVLYSATPLRMSTYLGLTALGTALFGERRWLTAGIALALAFLCRFDAMFTLLPAAVLAAATHSWTRVGRLRKALPWLTVALLVATIVGWAAYYNTEMGTWRFWGDVRDRQGSDPSFRRVLAFFAFVIPWHLGPLVLFVPIGLAAWLRGRARDPAAARWLASSGAATFGFLLLAVFLSGYRWDHNLFWKWLTASMPFLLLAGADGAWRVGSWLRGRRVASWLLAGGLAISTAAAWAVEGRNQLRRSDLWYGTQVRLTRWAEAELPPEATVVADLIPATYASRLTQPRIVHRWSDERVPGDDPEAFGAFLLEQRVGLVVWFEEDWVPCHGLDPWLAAGAPTQLGPARLLPIAREDSYGFIAYEVSDDPQRLVPAALPPQDAGGLRYEVR